MTTYFTSDIHESHDKIRFYSNRPYQSVEEMNAALIENINRTVKKNDTLWHLGDLSFGTIQTAITFLNSLNVTDIRLILGNHDSNLITHRNELVNSTNVTLMSTYEEIKIDKRKIVLCHYPFRSWNGMYSRGKPSYALHGHCHGELQPYGKSVDVGVDSPFVLGRCEYRPFSFEEIHEFMELQPLVQDF